MIYFLDFDRTLFDTDAYNRSLLDEPACAPFRDELSNLLITRRDGTIPGGLERIAIWEKVSEVIRSGELRFSPGALSHFVYTDVVEFLRMLGNEAIIITYGEKLRQQTKIESALSGIVRLTILYTEEMYKADYLSQYPHLVSASARFVDDHPLELEKMSTAFPHISLYEMRRDGGPGDGRWPVLHSLIELP